MNKTITLKKGEGRVLAAKGSWVFDNEIETYEEGILNGEIVTILAHNGFPLGQGFINTNSKIRIRLLTRDSSKEVDEAFIRSQTLRAYTYRKDLMDLHSCRLIFGEADFLPGFIVDKFDTVLVVQSLALGMEAFKGIIVDELTQLLKADGIIVSGVFERSDAKVREYEGLEKVKGFISEPFDTQVQIIENGVKFIVDVKDGQKTGFFLDQKFNRLAIHKLVKDKSVLDCFTHTGSFGLNAAVAGASSVTAIDISQSAIDQATLNAKLNHVEDKMSFLVEDVFEALPKLVQKQAHYDVVILDPPSFAKSREALKNALKGYRDINTQAIKLVSDQGYLVTASCTSFVTPDLFKEAIEKAAKDAHRRIRQVEYRTQSFDHPVLWGDESTPYLKFYIFQVIDEQ
ncbi:MAG: class I SAM-dependent rRNA methyltransferase [Erysipelotrichaceae bacterium]|nr:class I SAM-dependent rRNA methyltransferase [Erysipelotrichaceae bacterium]